MSYYATHREVERNGGKSGENKEWEESNSREEREEKRGVGRTAEWEGRSGKEGGKENRRSELE
ncbi:hypothetical protein SK128_002216, partial [Halocaridina rubra]